MFKKDYGGGGRDLFFSPKCLKKKNEKIRQKYTNKSAKKAFLAESINKRRCLKAGMQFFSSILYNHKKNP